jgi:pimeloyl-ACP methyl ester carboxylesterase
MTFYSGFSLAGEEVLFLPYHDKGDFVVSGFSLGAIDAFNNALNAKHRIDKLQLFSPAFFQESKESFKKVQLRYFKSDKANYVKNFLENSAYPATLKLETFYHDSPIEDLQRLLYFKWEDDKLETLRKRGILIEIYLGEKDKIIDAKRAADFFQPYATVIMIKDVGHILQKDKHG